jgi:serine/threonine protein kinase
VHRDLKPENIFIGAEGRAKIGDFGCSIQMNNEESVMASRLGSLAYMDKRVSDGDPYDMSVDIYSFGMIIFCIYKGKGIYDECTSEKNWAMMMNNIYVDYEKNMGGLIEDLP